MGHQNWVMCDIGGSVDVLKSGVNPVNKDGKELLKGPLTTDHGRCDVGDLDD